MLGHLRDELFRNVASGKLRASVTQSVIGEST